MVLNLEADLVSPFGPDVTTEHTYNHCTCAKYYHDYVSPSLVILFIPDACATNSSGPNGPTKSASNLDYA